MPKMQIVESISIHAAIEEIYAVLVDFHQWRVWSPWLIMEPEAALNISDQEKYYDWQGQRVGSGNMRIVAEEENVSVEYDLHFLTPWKSQADVRFELVQKQGEVELIWKMDSAMPFFMFWMKKMMEAFVGMDYRRGLLMLKEYIERGHVQSQLEFNGETSYSGCRYLGLRTKCRIDDIGPAMERDFAKLMAALEGQENVIEGQALSIYHKWDMVKGEAEYTSAVPVNADFADVADGFVIDSIPATKVYTLRHTGPYHHLGNAWSTLYAMQRNKELKVNKHIAPFEIYMNMPGEVPDDELMTDVYFPLK